MRKPRILAWILAISLIGIGWLTFAQEDWLVHDTDAWTITVYSGSYGIVIQDKNLWATVVWGWKNAPAESYWNYYQWWNNYGFPSDSSAIISKISTKVDASSYWPGNPYSSSTFVKANGDWNSVSNDNLRWWEWDDETNGWGLTSDNPITGRQWPCPAWYHIPSIWERNELTMIWYNNRYNGDLTIDDLLYLQDTATLEDEPILTGENAPLSIAFSEDLLVPYSTYRWYDDWTVETYSAWLEAWLRSSSPYNADAFWHYLLRTTRGNPKERYFEVAPSYDLYRAYGLSVRCFKDEHVYREVSKILTFNIISGENLISTWISFPDETPTSGQILDAISRLSDEIGLSTWYHLAWYVDDGWAETGFDLDTAILEWSITSSLSLTWQIEPNKYTISFLDDNWAEIMSGEFTYDQEAIIPANTSTKAWYTFKWWKDEQWNIYTDWATIKNLTTENGITLKFNPIREKYSQHSVGGGWWSHGSSIVKPDPEIQENIQNSWNETWHGSAELENWYTKEMNDAYHFAYQNGITTMDSIEKANMWWGLTRIAMAKMLAYYAINVLWMKPDETRINKFSDVSDELSSQYDNWVNLSYQLWIMWINMMHNMFRPFDLVTRAEFGTALSRMLYWLADWKKLYYETHLKKLTEEKIITNNDPNLRELRWYVMIMLMRSAMTGYNWDDLSDEGLHDASQLEVENYFTEAYKMWTIYYRIWDLQRLLQYLWFYDGEINNTYDKNTVNAVYDFQVAIWILDIDDTKNPGRWYLWPSTRDALNQKRAEFK